MAFRANDYNKEVTEEDFASQGISKINSAGFINFRINDLWKDAHRHAREGKYSLWNEDLDRVWMELIGDTEPGKVEEQQYDTATLAYSESFKNMKPNIQRGFEKVEAEDKVGFAAQKKALLAKESFLRRLQNKQGKGTAYASDDEDDFD